MKTTWRKLIQPLLEENGDSFDALQMCPDLNAFDTPFNDGYGTPEGPLFTAWSNQWVYFPVCYDGAEWVGCAPRNPCPIATDHQGGG
jgi:hypothetical protein